MRLPAGPVSRSSARSTLVLACRKTVAMSHAVDYQCFRSDSVAQSICHSHRPCWPSCHRPLGRLSPHQIGASDVCRVAVPFSTIVEPERLAMASNPSPLYFPAQDSPPITSFGHELRSSKPFAGTPFPDDTCSNELPFPIPVWPCLSFPFLLDTTPFHLSQSPFYVVFN